MADNSHAISIKSKLNALAAGETVSVSADVFRDAFQLGVLDKIAFASAAGCQPAHVFAVLSNAKPRKVTGALAELGFGQS